MKPHYDDYLEKLVASVLGIVGTLAILINLFFKGINMENLLDAIKDVSSIVITIVVFLVASKIFRKGKGFDFKEMFEGYLRQWAQDNKYLIKCKTLDKEKGKDKIRAIRMVVDHINFVTADKLADDIGDCGDFLRLPSADKPITYLEFMINSRTFERRAQFPDGSQANIQGIVSKFKARISEEFGEVLNITASVKDTDKIFIDLSGLDQSNEESARRLIDLIEFVKTLYLALA